MLALAAWEMFLGNKKPWTENGTKIFSIMEVSDVCLLKTAVEESRAECNREYHKK